MLVSVKYGNGSQGGLRPSHSHVDAEKSSRCVAAEKESAIDELMGSLGDFGVGSGESSLPDTDEDRGIASGDTDVGCSGSQALALHAPKLDGRKAVVEVFAFGGIDEVTESLNVDGLNLVRETIGRRKLKAASDSDSKYQDERDGGKKDKNDR